MNTMLKKYLLSFRKNALPNLLATILLIAIITLYIRYDNIQKDDTNWEQFKVAHDCKLHITQKGNLHSSNWLCNDGKEYYRWRQQR